jgi:hypothetical protein
MPYRFRTQEDELEAWILLDSLWANGTIARLEPLGFRTWGRDSRRNPRWRHWLFPSHWYSIIPNGYPVVNIEGNIEIFSYGETTSEIIGQTLRFGWIVGDYNVFRSCVRGINA